MRLALAGGVAAFLLVVGVLAWLQFSEGNSPRPAPPPASSEAPSSPNVALKEQPLASGQQPQPGETRKFVHPGLLHTEADFARMRAKVQAGAQPWLDDWKRLTSSPFAQLRFGPRPVESVVRGQGVRGPSIALLAQSAQAAYLCAVRWKVSGDEAYARKAVGILNAWSGTLKGVGGNSDRFLAVGIQGFQLANSGEIMRTYPGWPAEDFKRFQDMMLSVFYQPNHDFLVHHNGAVITNYMANWDTCNMSSMLAIGVLCDRRDIYDEAVAYFKNGDGNGAIRHAVTYLHPGYLGQWQESGRDQAHTQAGFGWLAGFCEVAWNQGDDLYGYDNNRLLSGAEYIARYNLGKDIPWQWYARNSGHRGPVVRYGGPSAQERGNLRPVYEMVYNHYVNRRGLDAPHVAQAAAKTRPEGGPGPRSSPSAFDELGYGTLTCTRDPLATPTRPSGLAAWKSAGTVILSWWGAAGARSYNVKRAGQPGGPYTTIASDIREVLTYTDKDLPPGKDFYYVVTGALSSDQETAPCDEVKVSTSPELQTYLPFDETSGTTAADASGHGHAGTLLGGATWVPGRQGNAVSLHEKGSCVSLPAGIVADLSDFTVATWVYLNTSAEGSRVFDFGGQPGVSMYLTPSGHGKVLFRVATHYDYTSQTIEGRERLPTGQWVHVAVTLSGRVGTLYVNGVPVGMNPDFGLAPVQLGATPHNWIGRSQFAGDPYLDGKVDDFRIYDGALPAADIAALSAPPGGIPGSP